MVDICYNDEIVYPICEYYERGNMTLHQWKKINGFVMIMI